MDAPLKRKAQDAPASPSPLKAPRAEDAAPAAVPPAAATIDAPLKRKAQDAPASPSPLKAPRAEDAAPAAVPAAAGESVMDLANLPADLLVEIMAKLNAQSIMNLAATSKKLWEFSVTESYRVRYRLVNRRSEYVGVYGHQGEIFYHQSYMWIPPRGLSLSCFKDILGDSRFSIIDSSEGKLLVCVLDGRDIPTQWHVLDPMKQTHQTLLHAPDTRSYFMRGAYIPCERFNFCALLMFLPSGPNSRKVTMHMFNSLSQRWGCRRVETTFDLPPRELIGHPNVVVEGVLYMLPHRRRIIKVQYGDNPRVQDLELPELLCKDRELIQSIGKTMEKELSLIGIGLDGVIHMWVRKANKWEKRSEWAPDVMRNMSRLTLMGSGTGSSTVIFRGTTRSREHTVVVCDTETQTVLPVSQDPVILLQPMVYELERPPTSGLRRAFKS